jgi:hypothetical protein
VVGSGWEKFKNTEAVVVIRRNPQIVVAPRVSLPHEWPASEECATILRSRYDKNIVLVLVVAVVAGWIDISEVRENP